MSRFNTDALLTRIREGLPMTMRDQIMLAAQLSVPAMLAMLSTIVMEYIDAAMVGRLGADDSASVGLVSSSLWLFGGLCSAVSSGFSVQVAHHIGANNMADARSVLRQALVTTFIFALLLTAFGVAISGSLPLWLGGNDNITGKASNYFLIFMLGMPFLMTCILSGAMLRSSGNMRTPSMLNILMCALDVLFNFLFIFPSHHFTIAGVGITVPGLGMGVEGAALGSVLAIVIVCMLMLYQLVLRSPILRLTQDQGSYVPRIACLRRAFDIGAPIGLQHVIMNVAQVVLIAIVAPLGSVAIAANSFAVTAESLCYMPGVGIEEAATTLVGQSVGARRRDLTRRFAYITVCMGMLVMGAMGALLYVGAPAVMAMMTPVHEVADLGVRVLRIEAFAEPLFAAAMVTYGVFVGVGDTLTPCVMNAFSMWAVRITLAALLVGSMGLAGVWTAMCIELCFRGVIFLVRLFSGRWMKKMPATVARTA